MRSVGLGSATILNMFVEGRVDRESLLELLEGQAWQSSHNEKQKLERS